MVKNSIKSGLKILAFVAITFIAIGFVGKRQNDKLIQKIDIRIDTRLNNYFIDRNELMNLITENGAENITGLRFNELPLKEIETRVKRHRFVQNAEVFKDLQGNLVVNAYQTVAMARVVQRDGPDAYISDQGRILPVSDKFTARVMIVGGDYSKKLVTRDLTTDSTSNKIFKLLKFIEQYPFWSVQIAQIDIDKAGNISFYPQVGNQFIEFGKPVDIENKFKKLGIFYSKILPKKGWNAYKKVNLKFKDQIICE